MTSDDFKSWRLSLGLSQPEAAAALGINRATIMRRENGESDVPKEAELATRYLSLARQICEIAGGLST